jgi:hypothetical protein
MLGLLYQALLVTSHVDQRGDGDEQAEHDRAGSDWPFLPPHQWSTITFVVALPRRAPAAVDPGCL